MTPIQAKNELLGAELVPLLEGSIAYIKELVDRCLAHGVPALLGSSADCGKGCAVKVQLLAREEDVVRAMSVVRDQWMDMVHAEGTVEGVEMAPMRELAEHENPLVPPAVPPHPSSMARVAIAVWCWPSGDHEVVAGRFSLRR